MKNIKLSFFALLASLFLLSSCEKDDDDNTAPIIEDLEIGLQNSKEFRRAGDVHIEFSASDNEGLAYYKIEIHSEMKAGLDGWDVDQRWDFDPGIKNTMIHHHEIKVPADAPLGDYHFHLEIVDVNGNSTSAEADVKVLEAAIGQGPEIHVQQYPADDETFANGQTISIAGHVHSDNGHVDGLFIGIVREADNLADEDVNASNAIVLFHQDGFEMYEVDFDASITVGAAQDNNQPTPNDIASWDLGEAYILVKAKTEDGLYSYSPHYHIVLNGNK
jgi:hypothetical protein